MADYPIWKAFLEASAQAIIGALGAFSFNQIRDSFSKQNSYESPMDFWKRGIHLGQAQQEDKICIDCIISPYTQLFPGDPFNNAKLWRNVYEFEGKVSAKEFQAIEFFVASDEALRMGCLNGETIVGLYNRYGYIGDGLIGIIPTQYVKKIIPDFFHKEFVAVRALVKGVIRRYPIQHYAIANNLAMKAGFSLNHTSYNELPYLSISSLKLFNKVNQSTFSLLGSPWAVTDDQKEQYLLQYGHFDQHEEISICLDNIKKAKSFKNAQVFYDDLTAPSIDLSFKKKFIL